MTKDRPRSRIAGEVAAAWWHDLQPDPERKKVGNRAALAQLRRNGSVPETLTQSVAIDLIQRISKATEWHLTPTAWWVSPTAVAAVTLSHLRHSGQRPMAEALGDEVNTDRARYSGLRFTRLIRAESEEERLLQLGRAARRLRADDAAIDIARLATDIFRLWSFPDDVRRDWTFQYHHMAHASGPAAPAHDNEVSQ